MKEGGLVPQGICKELSEGSGRLQSLMFQFLLYPVNPEIQAEGVSKVKGIK